MRLALDDPSLGVALARGIEAQDAAGALSLDDPYAPATIDAFSLQGGGAGAAGPPLTQVTLSRPGLTRHAPIGSDAAANPVSWGYGYATDDRGAGEGDTLDANSSRMPMTVDVGVLLAPPEVAPELLIEEDAILNDDLLPQTTLPPAYQTSVAVS